MEETQMLTVASDFFAPIAKGKVRLAATEGSPNVFNTGDSGLFTCIVAAEQVTPELQADLDAQKQNLMDLAGVASSYVRHQADQKKDPNLVYDTNLWQEVYNHLPLMGPSKFERQTFNQSMTGLEVATKFIETIIGAVVTEGASLADFTTFLRGLGDSIRLGVEKTKKTFSVGTVSIVLTATQVGGKAEILPILKGYFIDFSESDTTVYSNCASARHFTMNFDYRSAVSIFNSGSLKNPKVKSAFDAFITGNQVDDIANSSNFFNGSFNVG